MFAWAMVRAGLPIQAGVLGMVFLGGILGIITAIASAMPDSWLVAKREVDGSMITVYPTGLGRALDGAKYWFETHHKGLAVTLFTVFYMAVEIGLFIYLYSRSSKAARAFVRN